MGKIIDSDVLLSKLKQYSWAGSDTAMLMVEHAVNLTPSAIVRCKDCKHSEANDGKLVESARYCTLYLEDCNRYAAVWDGDFCCNGELRDDLQLIKDVLKKEKDDAQESEDSL